MQTLKYSQNGINIEVTEDALKDYVREKLGGVSAARLNRMPQIGSVYPQFGGIFGGIVKGSRGIEDGALFVPTDKRAFFEGVSWGASGKDVTDATDSWDGYGNTKAMVQAGCPIAKTITALEIDGLRDFHLMARFEGSVLYSNLRDLFDLNSWYLTSTQGSAYNAWCQGFGYGGQSYYRKDNEYRAFAVRRVPIGHLVI